MLRLTRILLEEGVPMWPIIFWHYLLGPDLLQCIYKSNEAFLVQLGNKGFGEPLIFDNAYYTALLEKPWLDPNNKMASMIGLPSDHVLSDSQACLPYIKEYAEDKQKFYKDFKSAYLKLTSLGTQFA